MNNQNRRLAQVLLATLGVTAGGAAFAWSDAAIEAWTARTAALVAAANEPLGEGAPKDANGKPMLYSLDARGFMYKPKAEEEAAANSSGTYINRLKAACDGLLGEQVKHGGRNSPLWAQNAQGKFCSGVKATNAALEDPANKDRCKELASAINYAGKAKPGEDPPAVVEAAASLAAAATTLRGLTVHLQQKGRVLGDGTRDFSCN